MKLNKSHKIALVAEVMEAILNGYVSSDLREKCQSYNIDIRELTEYVHHLEWSEGEGSESDTYGL